MNEIEILKDDLHSLLSSTLEIVSTRCSGWIRIWIARWRHDTSFRWITVENHVARWGWKRKKQWIFENHYSINKGLCKLIKNRWSWFLNRLFHDQGTTFHFCWILIEFFFFFLSNSVQSQNREASLGKATNISTWNISYNQYNQQIFDFFDFSCVVYPFVSYMHGWGTKS